VQGRKSRNTLGDLKKFAGAYLEAAWVKPETGEKSDSGIRRASERKGGAREGRGRGFSAKKKDNHKSPREYISLGRTAARWTKVEKCPELLGTVNESQREGRRGRRRLSTRRKKKKTTKKEE